MNLARINIVLAVLLLLVAALAAAVDVDRTRPNFEVLPEMKRSPAWAAYEANPNFPNRRTLQPPVPGTIARGELPLHYAATKEDALRAGEELENPYARGTVQPPADEFLEGSGSDEPQREQISQLEASVSRGAQAYRAFCVSCHGPSGAGDGPVAKRGFPPPPPLTTGKSAQMQDGQLFHILTYGQGSMAPMAAQLSRAHRWDVINYVRSLQQSAAQDARVQSEALPQAPDRPAAASRPPGDQP